MTTPAPIMSNGERLVWALACRRKLESEVHEAEILLGLVKGHLAKADEVIAKMSAHIENIWDYKAD